MLRTPSLYLPYLEEHRDILLKVLHEKHPLPDVVLDIHVEYIQAAAHEYFEAELAYAASLEKLAKKLYSLLQYQSATLKETHAESN